jgi:hypothetical protein
MSIVKLGYVCRYATPRHGSGLTFVVCLSLLCLFHLRTHELIFRALSRWLGPELIRALLGLPAGQALSTGSCMAITWQCIPRAFPSFKLTVLIADELPTCLSVRCQRPTGNRPGVSYERLAPQPIQQLLHLGSWLFLVNHRTFRT